jgi:hypothetical protein
MAGSTDRTWRRFGTGTRLHGSLVMKGGPPPRGRATACPAGGQLRFSAVSSMTNDVWSEMSSVPVNVIVIEPVPVIGSVRS